MTDDDGDWVGQIRLFPYSALKCLTFALLSFSFSSSSLSPRQKGACRLWIRQGPHLTPAASGLGNQTSSGCVSGAPSLYLFSYIWFDKSGTIVRRAGLSILDVRVDHPLPTLALVLGRQVGQLSIWSQASPYMMKLYILYWSLMTKYSKVGWTIKVSRWCTKKCP